MALAAILALQDIQHTDIIGALLLLEDLVVAIAAIEPFGVLAVRKQDQRHAGSVFKHDVQIQNLDIRFGENIGARRDSLGTQRSNPVNLITLACLGQDRQRFGWFLQQRHRGIGRIVNTVGCDGTP